MPSYFKNRDISDKTDEIFKLQGVNWFTRKIINVATVTLYVKHYKDDEGVEHIDIEQIGTGGIKSDELREVTGKEQEVNHPVFGPMSKRILLYFCDGSMG